MAHFFYTDAMGVEHDCAGTFLTELSINVKKTAAGHRKNQSDSCGRDEGDGLTGSVLHQAGDVFAEDVEFEVDAGTYFDLAEVGMFEGVGYDGHTERLGCGIAHS